MKIAIIGSDGQLGTDLCKVIPKEEQIPLTIKDIDITNFTQVKDVLTKTKADVVINTAAYHKVDDCEENADKALAVNGLGVRNLALVCKELDSVLVHISTDYVFAGDKGTAYTEADIPDPKSSYGISKLTGEYFVRYILDKHFIVRTCGLYGIAGCLGKGGTNFIEGMVKRAKNNEKIRVVTDEIITPTYTFDLAQAIYSLIQTKDYGLYHISNEGQCSWWEFASKIFESMKLDINVEKTTASEFKAKAHRPSYSVLDNAKLKKLNTTQMRKWDLALKDYLIEKGYIN